MTDGLYSLAIPNPLLTHGAFAHWFCRDQAEDEHLELRAQIRSGDYFATLATILDGLSQTVRAADADALHQLVTSLLYLQREYKIVPKTERS